MPISRTPEFRAAKRAGYGARLERLEFTETGRVSKTGRPLADRKITRSKYWVTGAKDTQVLNGPYETISIACEAMIATHRGEPLPAPIPGEHSKPTELRHAVEKDNPVVYRATPAGQTAAPADAVTPRRTVPQRGFEDFSIGEKFYAPSRTHSESLFYAFQLASGDNAPIHYDIEYCRSRGHPGLMAHGFQTLIQTAPGATGLAQQMEDALVGFLDQSSRFLKPVYSGDTLYPELEVVGLERQRTTGVMTLRSRVLNQRSEMVLEGELRFLLRLREPSAD